MGELLDWLVCMVGAVCIVWAAAAMSRSVDRHYDKPGGKQ